jgi:hypothetical protein
MVMNVLSQVRFAMLSTRTLQDVGPAQCFTIGANIMVVKERVNAEQTLLAWVRGKEPTHCPITALANYMVHLIDVKGFPLFNYMEQDLLQLAACGPNNYNPKWRQLYLLHGNDPFKKLPDSIHYKDIKRAFTAGELRPIISKSCFCKNKSKFV